MYFSNDILMRVMICVLAVLGFMVARHIYYHKKIKKPLVCPMGFDCNFVVHSNYSEFMHIPLEIFGMIYYALLAFFYLYFILAPEVISALFSNLLALASFGAFLFSLYLVFVQIFLIKKGCSWCVFSALISVLIFILILWK